MYHQSLYLLRPLRSHSTPLLYPTPNPHHHTRNHLSHNPRRNATYRAPNLHADRSHRRLGERQHPFNVVREPAGRESEDGGGVVAELEKEFEAACADPAGDFDAPVEGGFLGAEGFVCWCYVLVSILFSLLCLMKNASRGRKHTRSFILLQDLIMSSSQFRPFRKLILRAGAVHLPL